MRIRALLQDLRFVIGVFFLGLSLLLFVASAVLERTPVIPMPEGANFYVAQVNANLGAAWLMGIFGIAMLIMSLSSREVA